FAVGDEVFGVTDQGVEGAYAEKIAIKATLLARRTDVETLRPNVTRDRAHLERMLKLLEMGAVRPPPIAHYKLKDAAEAHRVSESRHLQGKLVLTVR
ncbi:MAG: zinc-binding dehydrogenase, partial [Pseudolabrys sp.]